MSEIYYTLTGKNAIAIAEKLGLEKGSAEYRVPVLGQAALEAVKAKGGNADFFAFRIPESTFNKLDTLDQLLIAAVLNGVKSKAGRPKGS